MALKTVTSPIGIQTNADEYLFKKAKNTVKRKKMLEVSLRVFKGEKMLIASNREMGIFTEGKNWNSLMKNIREVIEAYFDISSADVVKIKLEINPVMAINAL